MKLLVATGNRHKLEEFGRILAPLDIEIISPADAGIEIEVEETGETFAENARQKAEAYYEASGIPSVADDSGLCVDALDGRPGVYSARYLGENASYSEKIAGLLDELKGVADQDRTARFVCSIHCTLDEGTAVASEAACEGTIAHMPSGNGGFGYDPVFLYGAKTFADLSPSEKDTASHRGKALRVFAENLREQIRGTVGGAV